MQDWMNRLGLILQFLALWFVTPQIIGEERMLKVAGALTHASKRLFDQVTDFTLKLMTPVAGVGLSVLIFGGLALWIINKVTGLLQNPAVNIGVEVLWDVTFDAGGFLVAIAFGWVILLVCIYLLGATVRLGIRSTTGFLITGALLFTVGFGVLLAATWIPTSTP